MTPIAFNLARLRDKGCLFRLLETRRLGKGRRPTRGDRIVRTCPGESACRPTETNERRSRFGASGIRTSFLLRLVGLAVSLGLAVAVAMDDIDFFSAAAFSDTTGPPPQH